MADFLRNYPRLKRGTVILNSLTYADGRTQGQLKKSMPYKNSIYRVSHKKVYPFEANLEIIEFKSLAYVSHTIG